MHYVVLQSVYNFLEPIDSYYPEELELIVEPSELISFGIEPILSIPNSISISWFIDDQLIGEDITSIELETSMYSLGEHEIKVSIIDETDLVRNDPFNLLKNEFICNLIIECNTNPDLNLDYEINIQDIILLVNHILGMSDTFCIYLNLDGTANILDIIYIINIILN